jgi:hypothetical protein
MSFSAKLQHARSESERPHLCPLQADREAIAFRAQLDEGRLLGRVRSCVSLPRLLGSAEELPARPERLDGEVVLPAFDSVHAAEGASLRVSEIAGA